MNRIRKAVVSLPQKLNLVKPYAPRVLIDIVNKIVNAVTIKLFLKYTKNDVAPNKSLYWYRVIFLGKICNVKEKSSSSGFKEEMVPQMRGKRAIRTKIMAKV